MDATWSPRLSLQCRNPLTIQLFGNSHPFTQRTADDAFDGARRISSPSPLLIVPRRVEHRPVAEEEVAVLLFEPATTVNTGNVEDGRTRTTLERI